MFPFTTTTKPSSGLCGPLYRKEQMPEHFHELFIVTGYRHPKSSAWQCVLSLFDATNETLNFWTHFLPSWYFMWVLKGLADTLDFQHDPYTWPLLCYMFTCCIFPLASAVAHTFNVMSERARHVCFFLDYFAVSLFIFGAAMAYHAYCFPKMLVGSDFFFHQYVHGAAVCSVVSTAAACCTRFMRPSATRQVLRLSPFMISFMFDSFPLVIRLLFATEEETHLASTGFHLRQFIFAVTSGILYCSHIPERWKPGHFDIIGHSHQLFHVTTILGVMDQLQAILLDMQERKESLQSWMKFDLIDSVILMGAVFVGNTIIVLGFSLYLYLARNLDMKGMREGQGKCKCS